jgi:hypothetical protein
MKQVDLLLPFALPQGEMAPDLLKAMNTPSLAMLLSRAKSLVDRNFDDFSRALPHEIWLAERFGLAERMHVDNSPPVADPAMQSHGVQADAGYWFILHPVHIHIARDHLVLTDVNQLALSDMESRLLFEEALPLVKEAGLEARYGDPHTWFLRADAWSGLHTATPDAAGGHNIDIWMPKGEGERAWRKLQNEIQMQWHTHAVNAAREAAGKQLVNSLWLWGGSSLGGAPAASARQQAPYGHAINLPGWSAALGSLCSQHAANGTIDDVLAADSAHVLASSDTLIASAFAADWGAWLAHMQALEAGWFAPLLAALKAGKIDQLRLILSHNTGLKEFSINRFGLRKFWIAPALKPLTPLVR